MAALQFKYTDTELKELLKSLVIVVDSREQENSHILQYFESKKINYKKQKLDSGDYGCIIPKNMEYGIVRDIYISVAIEKKNGVDELANSFKDRTRFESEFIRALGSGTKIFLLVEDGCGYENLVMGNYRSQYDSKALLGSLRSFESRYNFITSFIDKKYSGNWIYYKLLYEARELLKR